MNRRQCLAGLSAGICGTVAGCTRFIFQPEPAARLYLIDAEVSSVESGWILELTTEVPPRPTDGIQNVTLVAYTDQGTVACERAVGHVDDGFTDFELQCTAFPAIISARSGLDCEDVIIDILYWTGSEEQQERRIPEEITDSVGIYRVTERECDESLPPERLLTETDTE